MSRWWQHIRPNVGPCVTHPEPALTTSCCLLPMVFNCFLLCLLFESKDQPFLSETLFKHLYPKHSFLKHIFPWASIICQAVKGVLGWADSSGLRETAIRCWYWGCLGFQLCARRCAHHVPRHCHFILTSILRFFYLPTEPPSCCCLYFI